MALFNLTELRARLAPGQRLIGLDPGAKTIGVALSDVALTLASPYGSLPRIRLRPIADDDHGDRAQGGGGRAGGRAAAVDGRQRRAGGAGGARLGAGAVGDDRAAGGDVGRAAVERGGEPHADAARPTSAASGGRGWWTGRRRRGCCRRRWTPAGTPRRDKARIAQASTGRMPAIDRAGRPTPGTENTDASDFVLLRLLALAPPGVATWARSVRRPGRAQEGDRRDDRVAPAGPMPWPSRSPSGKSAARAGRRWRSPPCWR